MDRKAELRHLAEADRRIRDAERSVIDQSLELEKLGKRHHDTGLAEQTLSAFRAALATMRERRDMIVKTIEQIDRGLI